MQEGLKKANMTVEATIALDLITSWGLIACNIDGEDSSGRQSKVLMAPFDVVDRAMLIADYAVMKFKHRGWLVDVEE